eukprot:1878616-Amphidinium_carterae.1
MVVTQQKMFKKNMADLGTSKELQASPCHQLCRESTALQGILSCAPIQLHCDLLLNNSLPVFIVPPLLSFCSSINEKYLFHLSKARGSMKKEPQPQP